MKFKGSLLTKYPVPLHGEPRDNYLVQGQNLQSHLWSILLIARAQA